MPSTAISADERDGLGRPLRYMGRPPISEARLSQAADGRIIIRLKKYGALNAKKLWLDSKLAGCTANNIVSERLMTLRRLTCLLVTIAFPCFANLLEAASSGNLTMVQEIIASEKHNETLLKKTLEGNNFDGFTAIQLAVYFGHTDVVRVLINAGAEFRFLDEREYNQPIFMALRRGHLEIVDLILPKWLALKPTHLELNRLTQATRFWGQTRSLKYLISRLKNAGRMLSTNRHSRQQSSLPDWVNGCLGFQRVS